MNQNNKNNSQFIQQSNNVWQIATDQSDSHLTSDSLMNKMQNNTEPSQLSSDLAISVGGSSSSSSAQNDSMNTSLLNQLNNDKQFIDTNTLINCDSVLVSPAQLADMFLRY